MPELGDLWEQMEQQYDYGKDNPFVQFRGVAWDGDSAIWTAETYPTREKAVEALMDWLRTDTGIVPTELEDISTALEPHMHLAAVAYQSVMEVGCLQHGSASMNVVAMMAGEATREQAAGIFENYHSMGDEGPVFMRSLVKHPEDFWVPIAKRVFGVD